MLLNSALISSSSGKRLPGGTNVQNTPHATVFPAGFARYITLGFLMNIPEHDHDAIVRRAIELLGGKQEFFAEADRELADANGRWKQNVEIIGRILRAHLFVEHYIGEYLAKANPRLGALGEAKVSFAQKVALLDASNNEIALILPGIKRLNKIRNRLAHNLDAQVTEEDATVFLSSNRFAALRVARSSEQVQTGEPIEILEDFSKHVAMALNYEFSPMSQAIAQAIQEVHLGRGIT